MALMFVFTGKTSLQDNYTAQTKSKNTLKVTLVEAMQQDAELRTDRWRCGGRTGQGLMADGDGGVSAVNSPQTCTVRIAQAPVAQAYQDSSGTSLSETLQWRSQLGQSASGAISGIGHSMDSRLLVARPTTGS